jgi:putative ABC transport system permease protein
VGADPALARMLQGELDFSDPAEAGGRAVFPPAIINRSVQQQLGARVGDDLIVAFQRQTAVPRESLFGRRASADVVQQLRLRLHRVVEDGDLGRFGLQPHQAQPLNIFVPLDDLETALGRPGKVNALLLAHSGAGMSSGQLATALDDALTLEDYGLFVRVGPDVAVLESRRFLIDATSAAAAGRAAVEVRAAHAAVLTYRATAIATDDRSVPYSTVTALDPTMFQAAGTLERLELQDGSAAPALGDEEILVNEWVAEDLAVVPGDSVTLSYYIVGPDEQLQTRHTRLEVSGVVAMTGLGADRGLTPDYPGIQGARNMGEWSTPFPVDLNRIRERDEVYWEQHGATPKAFVGTVAGARMWSNRFGGMTSLRFAAAVGLDLATTATRFEQALLQQLQPQQAGFVFQPVREQGLKAAAGATDFSMLFIGFSLFIITAALLLVVLLFRLGVEERLRELGLLMAVGFTVAAVRRRFLLEGVALALVGGIIGTAGALGYGWAMLAGLRYLWQEAVGTSDLQLHVEASSLVGGLLLSVVIVGTSIVLAVRRYARLSVRSLLAGSGHSLSRQSSTPRGRLPVAVLFALCAGTAALLAHGADSSYAAGLFFVSGAALLGCGLSVCAHWMKGRVRADAHTSNLGGIGVRMGVRDVRRHPGRSMLAISLIACACFVIVAVGASGRDFDDVGNAESTGGLALLAETDIPLFQSLTSDRGRDELALSAGVKNALSQSQVFAFRSRPGEDASCLNLYRPERPSVLGVPDEFIQRGGFRFKQVESYPQAVGVEENPWSLLNLDLGPGTIPVFGDYNSVRWILHLEVGDRLTLDVGPDGTQVELLLVGLLDRSVFQSELLMSAQHFERYFPGESGFGFYAFDVPVDQVPGLALDLERDLEAYGFDVMAASERAARFQAVENTYLSTFQTLGGLGLILGTLGLAIVSIRNALERRGELAVQRAFGFTRARLYRMLLTESGVLLLVGVVLGTGCALAAVLPHLGGTAVPWKSLAVTLGLVVAVGMASAAIAALLAMQAKLLPALKSG